MIKKPILRAFNVINLKIFLHLKYTQLFHFRFFTCSASNFLTKLFGAKYESKKPRFIYRNIPFGLDYELYPNFNRKQQISLLTECLRGFIPSYFKKAAQSLKLVFLSQFYWKEIGFEIKKNVSEFEAMLYFFGTTEFYSNYKLSWVDWQLSNMIREYFWSQLSNDKTFDLKNDNINLDYKLRCIPKVPLVIFFAEPLSGANLINILAAFLHLPKS